MGFDNRLFSKLLDISDLQNLAKITLNTFKIYYVSQNFNHDHTA